MGDDTRLTCPACQHAFTPKSTRHFYCQIRCRNRANYLKAQGRTEDRIPGDSTRACGNCGVSITHRPPNAKYCGTACSRRYHGQLSPARVAYNERNRTLRREWHRSWSKENRLQLLSRKQAYREANRRRHNSYQQGYRARKLGAIPTGIPFDRRGWERLVERYQGRCAYCGVTPNSLAADHVVPLSRGGRHAVPNLLPACIPCNSSKRDRFLVEWRRIEPINARPYSP